MASNPRRGRLRIKVNSFTFFVLGLSFIAGYVVAYLLLTHVAHASMHVAPLEAVEGGATFSLVGWGIYTLLTNVLG